MTEAPGAICGDVRSHLSASCGKVGCSRSLGARAMARSHLQGDHTERGRENDHFSRAQELIKAFEHQQPRSASALGHGRSAA